MADYPSITLLSQIDSDIPTDVEVNAKWPASDRQMKALLKAWLAQAHNDNGTIKAQAVTAGCYYPLSIVAADIADGTITAGKLAGSIEATQITAGAITSTQLQSRSGTDPATYPGAVATANLQNDAVTVDKIANGAVDTDQLAVDAVESTNIADDAVLTAHIKDDQVTGAKIANDTIDPLSLEKVDTNPRIPVRDGTNGEMCTVDGVIEFDTSYGTNGFDAVNKKVYFKFKSATGSSSTYAQAILTSPTRSLRPPTYDGETAYWNIIGFSSVPVGSTLITLAASDATGDTVISNGKIKLVTPGVYLVRATVSLNSTGMTALAIATAPHNHTTKALPTFATGGIGCVSYIPLGTTMQLYVEALVETDTANDPIYIYAYTQLEKETNAHGPTLADVSYASVHIIKL